MPIRTQIIIVLIGLCTTCYAFAKSNQNSKVTPQITFDYQQAIVAGESIDFLGIGYQLQQQQSASVYSTVGLQSYSAVRGNYPGLITLGFSLGLGYRFNDANSIEANYFIGAGGGGGANDGGGLLLSPNLRYMHHFKQSTIGIGWSQLDFANNGFQSDQVSISWQRKDYLLLKTNRQCMQCRIQNMQFAIGLTHYDRPIATEQESAGLIGISLQKSMNQRDQIIFDLNGAMQGDIDGYMSILLGYRQLFDLTDNVQWYWQLSAGPSGGGGVASGGGLTTQGQVGLAYSLADYTLNLGVGKTWAPEGQFATDHIKLQLGKQFAFIANKGSKDLSKQSGKPFHFGLSIWQRKYSHNTNLVDKNKRPYLNAFDLLGIELNMPINANFELYGSSVWAYSGNYGAYAEGLFGLGGFANITKNHRIGVKGYIGAAGGGGIDVGSGLMYQTMVSYQYRLTNSYAMSVQMGELKTHNGNFNPKIFEVGLRYRFTLFDLSSE